MDPHSPRLLLIDDDEDCHLLTRALLSGVLGAPFELDWASTFEAGLRALGEGRHDACLLDYKLGARDGLELLRLALASGCRVPVILLTGLDDSQVDLEAMKAGAADYLVKEGLDGARLARSIRYAVERQHLLDTLERQAQDLRTQAEELERYRQHQVETLSQALRDRLADLEAILDSTPAAIWIAHDRECTRITGNRYAEEMLRIPRGTNVSLTAPPNQRMDYQIWRDGKALPVEELPLQQAAAQGVAVRDVNIDLILEGGRIINLLGNAVPLLTHEGVVRGAVGSFLDVTARREAEAQRRKLEAKVQQGQKLESLGVLAGGVAHDFNNLLMGILGYADLALLNLPGSSPACRDLEQVIRSAQQAAELTRQMLAYSGKGRFVIQPLHLSQVVEEMRPLFLVSISKKIRLSHCFEAGTPAIEGDVVQVRQVIMNLVLNASEAIGDHPGEVIVRVGRRVLSREDVADNYLGDPLPAGSYVFVEISDTGSGMSRETYLRLFDPFFTTKTTGRGLGLAAVLGIVRSHHGTIKVDSQPGRGTTFTVLFPATDRPVAANQARPSAEVPSRTQGTALVIDDEQTVRELARAMLADMGFAVLVARDGLEGISLFREHVSEIDLVVLDMTMPQLDGPETYRELERIRGGVPVILSSGYNELAATSQFGTGELAGFLQKPYRYEDLVSTVGKALAGSAAQR